MASRLKWTPQEEELLKTLGSCDRKNKWTHIAKVINDKLPAMQRTAKQCREKYNNHLIFGERMVDGSWSQAEDEALFSWYRNVGAKWKKISESFPTKSQNTIKNRFYGNVRKIVRKLNKIGKQQINKSFKPIKQKSIIRIIQPDYGIAQISPPVIDQMKVLREKLLDLIQKGIYEDEAEENQNIDHYVLLIRQIHSFNCKCRFYRNFKAKRPRKAKDEADQHAIHNSKTSSSKSENDDIRSFSNSNSEQVQESQPIGGQKLADPRPQHMEEQGQTLIKYSKQVTESFKIVQLQKIGSNADIVTIDTKTSMKQRLQTGNVKKDKHKGDAQVQGSQFFENFMSCLKNYCQNYDYESFKLLES